MRSFEQEMVNLLDYQMISIFLKHPLCVRVYIYIYINKMLFPLGFINKYAD